MVEVISVYDDIPKGILKIITRLYFNFRGILERITRLYFNLLLRGISDNICTHLAKLKTITMSTKEGGWDLENIHEFGLSLDAKYL